MLCRAMARSPGNDIKGGSPEGPPWFRQLTVSHESVVEDVAILQPFRPFPLEGKGVAWW